jgi:tetratricopeptide (TPR) repeat protein
VILRHLADYRGALQDLDLLPPDVASTPWALSMRVGLLLALDRRSEARAAGADAVTRYRDDPDVGLSYALAVEADGKPEQSLELIQDLLKTHPEHAELLTFEGSLLRRLDRLPEAMAALNKAVEEDPRNPEARATLAGMLADAHQTDEAIAHLDRALGDNPERVDLLLQRARILARDHRTVEALEALDEAHQRGAGGFEAFGLRGDILLELGREAEAVAWYERAFQEARARAADAAGQYAQSLEGIARRLFESTTQYEQALDALRPLTEPGALSASGMTLRAELLRVTERRKEAIEQADMAIAAGGDYVRVSGTKAQSLFELNRSQEALTILDDILERDPKYLFGRSTQIAAFDEVGRASEAVDLLQRYFSEGPAEWRIWSQIAFSQLLADLGRYEDAAAKLGQDHLKLLDPSEADLGYWRSTLGSAYNRLGRVQEAAEELTHAMDIFGDDAPSWVQREFADALARRDGKLTDEATTAYRDLGTIDPPELAPNARADRAWAKSRLGQLDEAIDDYRAAFVAASDPIVPPRFRFVALLHAAGLPDAEMELERALAATAAFPDRIQANAVLLEADYILDLLGHHQVGAPASGMLESLRVRLAKQRSDPLARADDRAGG